MRRTERRHLLYRLFVVFGGLLVVALFVALVAPWFIPWSSYKQAFEREASRIIGQPVTVSGDASLRLLPLPSAKFTELSIGRYEDGTAMMTVESFSLTAELLPFLRGETRIVDMHLEGPQITVRVKENGTVDWTARKQGIVDPDNTRIENLQIEDATIQIDGLAGGKAIRGEGFSASVNAQSLFGPWRIRGDGQIGGVPSNLDISTGRLQQDGSLRVRLSAQRADTPYRLSLDGPVAIRDELLTWDGKFELSQARTDDAEKSGALPVSIDGLFAATPNRIGVSEYRMEVGDPEDPYTVSGEGEVDLRSDVFFRMSANGRQIDLDRLQADGKPASATDLEGRLAALQQVVDRIPIPLAQGEIAFSLPAIVAGDTVIREIRAQVRPDINGWQFDSLAAIFPGNTAIEAEGKLGVREDFGFSGHVILASRQPTGFATWLSGGSDASLRRLQSAGFEADVTLTGNQAYFDDLELRLDDVVLTGKLRRVAPVDGRGAIIADLTGRAINLDDLRAIYALMQGKGESAALTDHDLDIELNTQLLEAIGLKAHDVSAHVIVEDGLLSIERLHAGEFFGATIESSGRLADMFGKPEGEFNLSVKAGDGRGLVQLGQLVSGGNRFLDAWGSDAELTRDVNLELDFDARPTDEGSRGRFSLIGAVGGTDIAIRDHFEGKPAEWHLADHDLTIRLTQDRPAILMRQLSLPALPVDVAGPVAVTAEVNGKGSEGFPLLVTASAPGSEFSASGTVQFAESPQAGESLPALTYDLDLTLGSQAIDDWIIMAGLPLPGAGEGIPLSVTLKTGKRDGQFSFNAIDGQYGGAKFAGELLLDTDRPGRPKVSGEMALDRVSLGAIAELALGPTALAGLEEEMPASGERFLSPAINGIDFDLETTSDTADLPDGTQFGALAAHLVVIDDALSVPDFKFDWIGGRFSGNANLKNVDGNALINTQMRVSGAELERILALAGFQDTATGTVDANVTIDSNGRSPQALLASLTGNGLLSVADARFAGVTTAGFANIVAQSDIEAFEVAADTVRPIARDAMLGGSFAVREFSAPFSIAGGQLTVRNVSLADRGGEVSGNAAYSLATGRTELELAVRLDAGRDALPGAEVEAVFTWNGQPGDMSLDIDTTRLEGYLSMRAYEKEQRRVAIMQANVLEKQRLRRELATAQLQIALRESERQRKIEELDAIQRRLEEESLPPDPIDLVPQQRSEDAIDDPTRLPEEEAGQRGSGPIVIRPTPSPRGDPAERPAVEPAIRRRVDRADDSGNIFKNLDRLFSN